MKPVAIALLAAYLAPNVPRAAEAWSDDQDFFVAKGLIGLVALVGLYLFLKLFDR